MNTLKKSLNFTECKQQINIEVIGSKLRELMEKHKISTQVLSSVTGISVAAINNLKRAEGNPTIGTLNALSSFFNLPLPIFIGLEQSAETQQQSLVISLFDLRHANKRISQNIMQDMLIETPKNVDISSIFGVVINNNSLLPLYEKGSIFIVSEHQTVLDNDIVLVCIQNSLNAIKRIFVKHNEIYLKNINLDDSIEKYDRNEVVISGVVVQIIQKTV